MIYNCFCYWIKITWNKFNFSIKLVFFFNKTFTVIWYFKPFVSFKRSLNRSLILDLLVSNCTTGSSNWIFSHNYFNFIWHCVPSKRLICFYYTRLLKGSSANWSMFFKRLTFTASEWGLVFGNTAILCITNWTIL